MLGYKMSDLAYVLKIGWDLNYVISVKDQDRCGTCCGSGVALMRLKKHFKCIITDVDNITLALTDYIALYNT